MIEENEFVGACPLCSTKMLRTQGGFVECPSGHYKILETEFDAIWNAYNTKMIGVPGSEYSLLKLLVENNVIDKPTGSSEP